MIRCAGAPAKRYARRTGALALALGLALPVLCGCRSVGVRVTAFQSREVAFPPPDAENTICAIACTEPPEALFEAEVTSKIEHLLAERGYQTAPQDEAKYLLFCFFGIDDGRTYTGTHTIHEPGEIVTRYYYGRRGRYGVSRTHYPGRTHHVPYSYTLFTKHLSLELTDRAKLDQAKDDDDKLRKAVIWHCNAASASGGSDLRWFVNHLLVAAFEYLGQDTARQERVTIRAGDDRIEALSQPTPP